MAIQKPSNERLAQLVHLPTITNLCLLIIGLGRTGFASLRQLVQWPIHKIIAVDHDVVSSKELGSLFPGSNKEKYKVRAAKNFVRYWHPQIEFVPVLMQVGNDSLARFKELIKEADILLWLADAWDVLPGVVKCAYPEIPMVGASISEQGSYAEVAWSVSGQTRCISCTLNSHNKKQEGNANSFPLDIDIVANLVVRVALGIALSGKKGFELFQPVLDPSHSLIVLHNRHNDFTRSTNPLVPMVTRLIETSDTSCSVCRGQFFLKEVPNEHYMRSTYKGAR